MTGTSREAAAGRQPARRQPAHRPTPQVCLQSLSLWSLLCPSLSLSDLLKTDLIQHSPGSGAQDASLRPAQPDQQVPLPASEDPAHCGQGLAAVLLLLAQDLPLCRAGSMPHHPHQHRVFSSWSRSTWPSKGGSNWYSSTQALSRPRTPSPCISSALQARPPVHLPTTGAPRPHASTAPPTLHSTKGFSSKHLKMPLQMDRRQLGQTPQPHPPQPGTCWRKGAG